MGVASMIAGLGTHVPHARSKAGGRMDFVERLFGVSPDGGNGMFELLLLLVVVVVVAAAMAYGSSRLRR